MADYRVREADGDPERLAVILPGRGYTAQAPLLNYAAQVLRGAGWSTRTLAWDAEPADADRARSAYEALVRETAAADRGRLLIVGKSLGTLVLPLAIELGIPGAWLTPLISQQASPQVRAAALSLADAGLPALLAGGTADRWWDAEVAARSGATVIEAAEANHSLEIPGDWRRSLTILGQVTAAVARLVARVEQDPGRPHASNGTHSSRDIR